MQLPVQTFSTMVQEMAATLQGTASQLVDLSIGSVLRALLEACASVALWLQWIALLVLSATRAATSVGADLDSWMADFSFFRLSPASSVGVVTFSRYSTSISTTVPVGAGIRVAQGSQTFYVTEQTANPAWNGSSGYTLASGIASIEVPVAASQPGAAGNVQSGAISLLASPIPGVDSVTNALPTTGGVDGESDAALRARFQLYINSRSLATEVAVLAAIANLQQGLRYTVLENQAVDGQTMIGNFCAIVDDGTGAPANSLLSSARAAINDVRPIGSTFTISAPVVVLATVDLVLQTSNAVTHASVAASVQQNIVNWIATLPIAGTLATSKLEAIAHD
jgi:uncharacterized phage protein gp47/JayE